MKKKVLVVLMAIAIILSMSVTAFAVTNSTPTAGSLTVTGDELTGKTVKAYRVFTASWLDENETDENDDNIDQSDLISYVLESQWNNFFGSIPAIAADTSNKSLSEKATNYVAGLNDAQMLQLAKDLKAYAKTNSISADYTSGAATDDSVTITGMVPGYYLVIPQSGSTSTARETDATLLNVPSAASASWNIKSDYPTVEKTVDNGKKETTAQIGDIVEYKLESAVPDMTEYDTYDFSFVDTMSNGLTYQYTSAVYDGVTVTIDGDTVSSDKYTVTFDQTKNKLTIAFKNLKTDYETKEGKQIVAVYHAMINSNAVIAGTGNVNSAKVVYSNDPDVATSHGESTPSSTTVYTYQITINKNDGSQTPVPLANAVFKLKASDNSVIKLIPTGTTNEYRVANADEIAAATNNSTVDTVTTDSSGTITIKGLKADTYKLEEVTAPTGYNKLGADITIIIAPKNTGTEAAPVNNYGTPTYTVDSLSQDTNSTINVVNTKGAVLPTTGGIGTIGLTLLGVGVVIIGIVLPSRKRKKLRLNNND